MNNNLMSIRSTSGKDLADLAKIRSTQAKLRSDSNTKASKAASEFEAILVSEWLNKAQRSFATVPGEDEENGEDAGGNQYRSLGIDVLAKSIAASGGFGIGRMIMQAIENQEVTPQDNDILQSPVGGTSNNDKELPNQK